MRVFTNILTAITIILIVSMISSTTYVIGFAPNIDKRMLELYETQLSQRLNADMLDQQDKDLQALNSRITDIERRLAEFERGYGNLDKVMDALFDKEQRAWLRRVK